MSKQYFPHVDGLRAVAVLSVLLFHLEVPFINGGYVGVDIFLVISGFLITLLLKKEFDSTGSIRLGQFYIRRLKRILPALVTTLFVSFFFAALIHSSLQLQATAGSISSALFGLSNFWFWLEADYFDTSTKLKPLLHTWSLGLEEQFYLLWSLMLFILYKLRLNHRVLIVIALILFASLILNYKFANGHDGFIVKYLSSFSTYFEDNKSTMFYLLPFRIYEFGIGGVLAYLYSYKVKNKSVNDLIFSLGLLMILYSLLRFNHNLLFPYYYGLIPTIGAALVIFSGDTSRLNYILNNKLMISIGLISYSLYLVHWPIISFYHYLHRSKGIDLNVKIMIAISSFVLSFMMYKFVETPLRKASFFSKTKIVLLGGLGFFVLLFCFSLHAYKYSGWEWRISKSIVNLPPMENSKAFHKEYYGGSGYPYYGPVNTDKEPDLIVIGDSHGRHYAEGLYKIIAEPNGLSFYVASGTSCFHLPNFTRITQERNWDKSCPARLETIKGFINKSINPPLVIVSHSWDTQMVRGGLLDENGKRIDTKIDINHIKEGVLQLKKIIGDSKLVVIGNVPKAGHNLYDIFTRPKSLIFNNFKDSDYIWRERDPKLKKVNWELKKLSEKTGQFIFLDPFDILCDLEKCQNIDDEHNLIYSDNGHLSKFGSIYVIKGFKDKLMGLLR